MIVLAWIAAVVLGLLVLGVLVVMAMDDPEVFGFMAFLAFVVAVIYFGGWGIGYIAGAWHTAPWPFV